MVNFDEFSKRYDKLRTADLGIIQLFIDKAKLQKDSNILDFGCGTGNYLVALRNNGFNNLYGIDNSLGMLTQAKNKLDADLIFGDHYNYPIFENYFDFIFLIDVIHLIDNMDLLVNRFIQSLKWQGIIAVVTQSHEQINNYFFNKYFPSVSVVDIARHPSIDKITSTFKQLGFSLKEKISYIQDELLLINEDYLRKMKEKCFTFFELIPTEEFDLGIKMFENDLNKNKSFTTNHWGYTILFFERG
jgi:ubiquinone/menaquinone biosynthesis C-methylase UbiE